MMDACLLTSPLDVVPADILQLVFAKIPFPYLVSLRVVSKKWNAIICALSVPPLLYVPKCVPVHFLNDELNVYNSRIKAWEKHSLAFFQDLFRTTRLELVATAGGLMCFETEIFEQLIVCNPISKLWKLIPIPSAVGDKPLNTAVLVPPCTGFVASSGSDFSAGDHHRTLILQKKRRIVSLLVDPVTGNHYKIVVASLHDECASGSGSSTVIYNSLTSSWTRGANVPEGEEFSDGNAILCNGSLYCLVKTLTFNGELFRYDVEGDIWSTLSLDMSVMRCKLVEHCGRVLLVKRNAYYTDDSTFRFFQLRDNSNQSRGSETSTLPPTDHDLSGKILEETDLIESLNLDAVTNIMVSGHLKSTGRGCVLGQQNCLYVLKPPYEDGLRKKRTLVTVIDLSTGSCDVLHELILASTTTDTSGAPEKHRVTCYQHIMVCIRPLLFARIACMQQPVSTGPISYHRLGQFL